MSGLKGREVILDALGSRVGISPEDDIGESSELEADRVGQGRLA
jgi:hypothetical protein